MQDSLISVFPQLVRMLVDIDFRVRKSAAKLLSRLSGPNMGTMHSFADTELRHATGGGSRGGSGPPRGGRGGGPEVPIALFR